MHAHCGNALNSSAVIIFLLDQYQWENSRLLFMVCSQYSAHIGYKSCFSSIRWIFWGTWLQMVVPKGMSGYLIFASVVVSVVWEPGALSWIKGIENTNANLNLFSIALKQEQYQVLFLHSVSYFLFVCLQKKNGSNCIFLWRQISQGFYSNTGRLNILKGLWRKKGILLFK